jgi:hypothetical protein
MSAGLTWDAPQAYARRAFLDLFKLLRDLDQTALKRDRHVELRPGVAVIMSSPNGSRWKLTVGDDGAWNVEGPL